MRYLILITCLLHSTLNYGQANRFTIAAQGNTAKSASNILVTQSIGQLSVIGNQFNSEFKLSSGYQKPLFASSHSAFRSNSFKVYPNPFDESITIQLQEKDNFAVTIFELNGRVVFSRNTSFMDHETTINFTKLKPGLYIVQLTGENESMKSKIIKQ